MTWGSGSGWRCLGQTSLSLAGEGGPLGPMGKWQVSDKLHTWASPSPRLSSCAAAQENTWVAGTVPCQRSLERSFEVWGWTVVEDSYYVIISIQEAFVIELFRVKGHSAGEC